MGESFPISGVRSQKKSDIKERNMTAELLGIVFAAGLALMIVIAMACVARRSDRSENLILTGLP